jgi:hypothetical protein
MADIQLHVIRTFLNVFDAEVAQGALESAEIESMVRADDCRGTEPNLWMGGVQLLVRLDDAARAEEVLTSFSQPSPESVTVE